jgi:hypothetical protein
MALTCELPPRVAPRGYRIPKLNARIQSALIASENWNSWARLTLQHPWEDPSPRSETHSSVDKHILDHGVPVFHSCND